MFSIPQATGSNLSVCDLLKEEKIFNIIDFGAKANGDAVKNTIAINQAIESASQAGGGTVLFPEGDFKTYTICLKSNVNLYLSKGTILHAARTDIRQSYEKQEGEGGNYAEPEVNLYAGLQDHGHTYFANSLLYGVEVENVMIYGEGVIDGSYFEEETGYRKYVLQGGDPFDPEYRNERGHGGEWFGNKGIALVRCNNIILSKFSIVIGGHFAIIAEGVVNLLVEDLCVDTTRDALDIDCCENVTVRRSVFNSLTDDAVVLKASYGAGKFMPTRNVLIEECTVSGYDAGSVYAGKYTRDKLIATDRCGPTARMKLGTESTCGYDLVTIRNVKFDRSRGFALEAVDISDLSNIIFTNCIMENVSSSPIFIRIGERGRFPVTGNSRKELLNAEDGNVRLDNRNWVLPKGEAYECYPAKRYIPSYNKTKDVSVDGHAHFTVVDQDKPTILNPANYVRKDGKYYGVYFDEMTGDYVADYTKELTETEIHAYGNAVGSEKMPQVYNIEISNVTVKNADPRYPIILMGLTDSKIKNVYLKNIEVEYRGGLTMEHAVEQRQLNTNWKYAQFETKASIQTLPWLVNTFFLKEEGLLPRVDWNQKENNWVDNPYNVPEMPAVYPEPSNWGILPAYGLYARHVEGLYMDNITFKYMIEDERHPIVMDDVRQVDIKNTQACCKEGVDTIALITNHFKRHTNREYVKEESYFTTTVEDVNLPENFSVKKIAIHAPAPGTPTDSLYPYPTLPIPENGYQFATKTEDYPLPLTVHRPFIVPMERQIVQSGDMVSFKVKVRNPAIEAEESEAESFIYNEAMKNRDYTVKGIGIEVRIRAENLPEDSIFDEESGVFTWKPKTCGIYQIVFICDDGVIPEKTVVEIEVK